jgi:PPOX class probable F420-dependent enzyme
MAATIEGPAQKLIDGPNFANLATLGEDGRPHLTVIWIGLDDGHLLVNSAEGRKWPENLRRDPRVTITVPDKDNPYEYVEIRGRVVEDTHDGADDVINQLSKKYLGQDEYPFRQPGEERVTFKIEPEKIRYQGG